MSKDDGVIVSKRGGLKINPHAFFKKPKVKSLIAKLKNYRFDKPKDFTVTLGLTGVRAECDKTPNYQIMGIQYQTGMNSDQVKVTIQKGDLVKSIAIGEPEAVALGFIDPYGLAEYCSEI